MKKLLLLVVLALTLTVSNAQNKKVKAMLSAIEGKWELDESQNLTYTKIIDLPTDVTKEEAYARGLEYFTYNYGDGDEVVQIKDKKRGAIVGKGIFTVFNGFSSGVVPTEYKADHIIKINIKENRARIVISLTQYEIEVSPMSGPSTRTTKFIYDTFPIKAKGMGKTTQGKAFYGAHNKALESLEEIAKAIIEGNSSVAGGDDW